MNQLGQIRTVSDVVPFNRTLLTRNKSGRLRASPTMGTDCMPFNQARGSVTLRAASRPYGGVIDKLQFIERLSKTDMHNILYLFKQHFLCVTDQQGTGKVSRGLFINITLAFSQSFPPLCKSYPHSPQVYPQLGMGKTVHKPGVLADGCEKVPTAFHRL